MKYDSLVLDEILSTEKWKTTAQIRKEAQKLAKKTINWYTIHYLLNSLAEEEKVEKAEAENVTLWRKT